MALATAIGLAMGSAARGQAPAPAAPPAARPNIVLIMTDDQSPTAVGFAGNTQVRTPHIDRIAREGARLTGAFVTTPVCSPSRAGLVASRYSSELKILDWINPQQEPEQGLDPRTVTWMQCLQKAGYRTGLFGKWHLGTADRYHPTRLGYDEFAGFRDGGRPTRDALLEVDGRDVATSGFIADVVTDHAVGFLERNHDRPFVCSLHFREPHSPWLPIAEEDARAYRQLDVLLPEPNFPDLDGPKVARMTREYYASIASVDRNVGRVLDKLDQLMLADNTVVIFTSDHGYHTGHHGLWFKGNAQWQTRTLPKQTSPNIPPLIRPNLYDQALRTPTAVRWPRAIKAGTLVERTITNLDWYPTLLAMAGVAAPAGVKLWGRDALPLLRGENIDWNDELYAEYSMRHGATCDMRAWRTADWKLVRDFANPGRDELYHLRRDPGETQNLIDSTDPEVLAVRQQLEKKLLARMHELGDAALPR